MKEKKLGGSFKTSSANTAAPFFSPLRQFAFISVCLHRKASTQQRSIEGNSGTMR